MKIPEDAVRKTSAEYPLTKPDHLVTGLVRECNVLLCADRYCPNATNAIDPFGKEWALVDGWWFCPDHWTHR